MGILDLKYITESDPDLRQLRERFKIEFPDVNVGEVSPERGSTYYYSSYFIQIKPSNFPPLIHFEYWADRNTGFLELHLEPDKDHPDEMKAYKMIGIRLMHILSEEGIEYGERWGLPFGYFRMSGISSVDDLLKTFKSFYNIVNAHLYDIYQAKKRASTLVLKYPNRAIEYKPLGKSSEEVSVSIMNLKKVMMYNLSLPDYQRDYCWEDKHITDLWKNLKKIQAGKAYHLGTVILHDHNGRYDIIDGQQRLITLSIILLALGYDDYLPLLTTTYDSMDAQEHIANCKYIVQTLVDREKNMEELAERLAENISFAVLCVNESNLNLAYTFFSNQNSKGVQLSDFDLLKAHHLRFIPNDVQAEHMAIKWNKLTMLPVLYKEKNALQRVLGSHIYRLRRWMRKNDSHEGNGHFIQQEYQSAVTMPDIPPFGEKFDYYEKIQGGTHFFVFAETFVHRYQEFLMNPIVRILQKYLAWGSYEIYSDSIETVLFGYYLKFGNQYLAETTFCISQIMALHRYNSPRVSSDGSSVRGFVNESELIMMIDQASSPTFLLAEALDKLERLSQEWAITSGMDLPESSGVKWGMYKALQRVMHEILPDISEIIIRNKIIEEYGK